MVLLHRLDRPLSVPFGRAARNILDRHKQSIRLQVGVSRNALPPVVVPAGAVEYLGVARQTRVIGAGRTLRFNVAREAVVLGYLKFFVKDERYLQGVSQ